MNRLAHILFWSSLSIAVSVALYQTSYRVENLNRQLRSINAQIAAEQSNIHVLKAEWSYLAAPARVEQAARKHLGLQPTNLKQVATLSRLPDLLPTRTEQVAGLNVEGAPMASVATPAPAPRPQKVAAVDRAHVNTRMVFKPAVAETNSSHVLPGSIILASYGTAR